MHVVGVVLWFVALFQVASDRSSAPSSCRQFCSCAPPPWASLSASLSHSTTYTINSMSVPQVPFSPNPTMLAPRRSQSLPGPCQTACDLESASIYPLGLFKVATFQLLFVILDIKVNLKSSQKVLLWNPSCWKWEKVKSFLLFTGIPIVVFKVRLFAHFYISLFVILAVKWSKSGIKVK